MSAVQGAVQALGGAISVRSQENVGTCWRLSIPLWPMRGATRAADLHTHNGLR